MRMYRHPFPPEAEGGHHLPPAGDVFRAPEGYFERLQAQVAARTTQWQGLEQPHLKQEVHTAPEDYWQELPYAVQLRTTAARNTRPNPVWVLTRRLAPITAVLAVGITALLVLRPASKPPLPTQEDYLSFVASNLAEYDDELIMLIAQDKEAVLNRIPTDSTSRRDLENYAQENIDEALILESI